MEKRVLRACQGSLKSCEVLGIVIHVLLGRRHPVLVPTHCFALVRRVSWESARMPANHAAQGPSKLHLAMELANHAVLVLCHLREVQSASASKDFCRLTMDLVNHARKVHSSRTMGLKVAFPALQTRSQRSEVHPSIRACVEEGTQGWMLVTSTSHACHLLVSRW